MRLLRMSVSVLIGVVVVLGVALSGQWMSHSTARAQDGGQCETVAAQALASAQEACAGLERGDVCFGHVGVTATMSGTDVLTASGERVAVADIDTLQTTAANVESGEWGIAALQLPVGLPDTSTGVTAVLFGAAQMTRPAQVAADRPTLTILNSGGAPVNLRNGAGITYDLVGQLAAGEEAVADGRNEQSDWLRIQFSGGIAWVFTPLINWDGDYSMLSMLEVLLPNDVSPVFEAGEPFQSFALATGEAGCPAAPSGLLLQYAGEATASVVINETTIEFNAATLLVTATANDSLQIKVLAGSATVTARGIPQEAEVGAGVRVNLAGEDGLLPVAAPASMPTYAFPDIAYAPLDLLSGRITCMVGVPARNADVALRVGPGVQRGEFGSMNANASYAVIGWAEDPDGAPWWELDTGDQSSWAAQADVRAVGGCMDVVQVEAPPIVIAAPPVPAGDPGAAPASGPDLAPTTNSVWQMVPGTDNMSGDCSGAPAINFCDHLAAIGPVAGGISWRGMEPTPYVLTQAQPNVYAYSGPNALGTGTVTMSLTFTSGTTLSMTMSLVLNNEPNCQHVYYYTGTKNW